jgi:hypothetical protein
MQDTISNITISPRAASIAAKIDRALVGLEALEDALDGYYEQFAAKPGCEAAAGDLDALVDRLNKAVVRGRALRGDPDFVRLAKAGDDY